MDAKDLKIGTQYGVTRQGSTVPVVLLEVREYTPFVGRTVKRYICRNTITKRQIIIKSARRFRSLTTSNCKHD